MQIAKAVAEISKLKDQGLPIELVTIGSQPYGLVRGIDAPASHWDKTSFDIMFAIPVAYDMGAALDAFYLRLPYKYRGGVHNRVSGQTLTYENASWQLVSWHYADNTPFQGDKDTIEGHVVHCKGFFLERGATNARA